MAKRKDKNQFRVVRTRDGVACVDQNGNIVSNDKCIRLGISPEGDITLTLNKKYCPIGVVKSFNERFKDAVKKGGKTIYAVGDFK